MIALLGYFFISLITSVIIVFSSSFSPGNFLDNFLVGNFLSVFSTLVGFEMAAIIFFLGQLTIIEEKVKESCFNDTKIELKHSLICIIILFLFSFLLLIFYPNPNDIYKLSNWSLYAFYIIKTLIISFFILAMINIFEILKNIFKLNIKNKK